MKSLLKDAFRKLQRMDFDSCAVCQDVALLDKLIKEDIEAGKLPLLLIANAGEGKHLLHYRNLKIVLISE